MQTGVPYNLHANYYAVKVNCLNPSKPNFYGAGKLKT